MQAASSATPAQVAHPAPAESRTSPVALPEAQASLVQTIAAARCTRRSARGAVRVLPVVLQVCASVASLTSRAAFSWPPLLSQATIMYVRLRSSPTNLRPVPLRTMTRTFYTDLQSVRQDVRAPGSQGVTIHSMRLRLWAHDCALASAAPMGLSLAQRGLSPAAPQQYCPNDCATVNRAALTEPVAANANRATVNRAALETSSCEMRRFDPLSDRRAGEGIAFACPPGYSR